MKKSVYNNLRRIGALFLLMTVLLVGCGKSVEKHIAEQLELGNKYLTEANYEQAIVAFNKVIELDPKQAIAYIGLTQLYVKTADFEKAVQVLEDGKEYLEDSYGEQLKEVYKEEAKSFSDDLKELITFLANLEKQEYSNEAFYLEMAAIYREKGMLDAEERCLEIGYRVCETDELKSEWERVRDEHKNRLIEVAGGKNLNQGWCYGDYDSNGIHEMFLEEYEEGYHDSSIEKPLYDMELYYVTDKKIDKLLSTQVPRSRSGIYNLPPHVMLAFADSEKAVTKYFIFRLENEFPQLVFENEDLNISYEEAEKEFEQFCETQSKN